MAGRDHIQTRTFAVGEGAPVEQQPAIADVPTAASATAAGNADAINALLAALRAFGLIGP
jgi:hypothetical protein